MKFSKGFTLIELMVVVSIISMLSSVVLASVASARVRGRDGVRYQQVHQMDIAVQLYMADKGKAPLSTSCPSTLTLDASSVNTCVAKSNPPAYALESERAAQLAAWDALKSELSPYMPGLKADPCGTDCPNEAGYVYVAPAAALYACIHDGLSCSVADDSYQVYTKLERTVMSVGRSNVLGLSSYYDPASPPPSGGGGGGGGGGGY